MARVCIFCQKGRKDGLRHKITREDIWPIWLIPYVPRDLKSYHSASVLIERNGQRHLGEKWTAIPRSRRVRFVCGKCNNGWMSQLQEKAKYFLLPLMTGGQIVLDQRTQELIAKWFAMSAMT
jgi:hypothetical protein